MKFRMIKPWEVRYFFKRLPERIAIKIAWALPKYLVMWCAVRVGAHATTGKYGMDSPTDLTMTDALKRWDKPNE